MVHPFFFIILKSFSSSACSSNIFQPCLGTICTLRSSIALIPSSPGLNGLPIHRKVQHSPHHRYLAIKRSSENDICFYLPNDNATFHAGFFQKRGSFLALLVHIYRPLRCSIRGFRCVKSTGSSATSSRVPVTILVTTTWKQWWAFHQRIMSNQGRGYLEIRTRDSRGAGACEGKGECTGHLSEGGNGYGIVRDTKWQSCSDKHKHWKVAKPYVHGGIGL